MLFLPLFQRLTVTGHAAAAVRHAEIIASRNVGWQKRDLLGLGDKIVGVFIQHRIPTRKKFLHRSHRACRAADNQSPQRQFFLLRPNTWIANQVWGASEI